MFWGGRWNSLCSIWIDIGHPFIFFVLWSIDFFFSNVCTKCLLLHLSKRKKKQGHVSSLSENEGDFPELIIIKISALVHGKGRWSRLHFPLVGELSGEEAGAAAQAADWSPSVPASRHALSRAGRHLRGGARPQLDQRLYCLGPGDCLWPSGLRWWVWHLFLWDGIRIMRCLRTQKIIYGEETAP